MKSRKTFRVLLRETLEKFPKIFDSTTKIIVWCCLVILFYFAFRILDGWEAGLEGAPSLFITDIGAISTCVAFYIWQAKNDHMLGLARPYGLGKKCVESMIENTNPNHSHDAEQINEPDDSGEDGEE